MPLLNDVQLLIIIIHWFPATNWLTDCLIQSKDSNSLITYNWQETVAYMAIHLPAAKEQSALQRRSVA